MKKLCVMICYKDRPTELAMLLQSLYTQTYKDFDILIVDDMSGTPLSSYHFITCIFNLMRMNNHKMIFHRNDFPHGVSKNRQKCVDLALKEGYELLARVDDDVVLEADFLERLLKVLDEGYDLASGVTPPMAQPTFTREPKFIGPIANRVILKDGEYVFNGDDCGMKYTDSLILPMHHFRSSALYKAKIHEKVNYLPTKLSKHGFREEQIFSYKCLMNGFKLGVDTGAIAWHQMTPSGGERFAESNQLIQHNQLILEEFTKENELNDLFPEEPKLGLELMKETNLAKIK